MGCGFSCGFVCGGAGQDVISLVRKACAWENIRHRWQGQRSEVSAPALTSARWAGRYQETLPFSSCSVPVGPSAPRVARRTTTRADSSTGRPIRGALSWRALRWCRGGGRRRFRGRRWRAGRQHAAVTSG